MKTITLEKAKKEKKFLKNFLEGSRNIGKKEKDYLKKRGYQLKYLGTGESAKIHSKNVKIMNIKSRHYLKGTYLVVGASNIGHGKGVVYRGYVKKVLKFGSYWTS